MKAISKMREPSCKSPLVLTWDTKCGAFRHSSELTPRNATARNAKKLLPGRGRVFREDERFDAILQGGNGWETREGKPECGF